MEDNAGAMKTFNPAPSPADILWTQLSALPAFRALIRAQEARLFIQLGNLPRPLLDVGCGDGHFAQSVWEHIDAGIDPHAPSLREAQRRGLYGRLYCASATRLPFAAGSFGGAFSNCVIEHIPDCDAVMAEVARVLQPGGRFVFSVPTDRQNDALGLTRAFNALGLRAAAERYKAWFRKIQVHHHMHSPDEWQRRAEAAGLRVVKRVGYMPARAMRWFDLLHYYGAPNLAARKLTGRWVVWPWRPRFILEEKALAGFVAEDDPPDATCCFFVAVKP